jgi:hypothetical protein
VKVTRGRLLVGAKITFDSSGYAPSSPELDKVWEVLTTDFTPREHLDGEYMELYMYVLRSGGLHTDSEPFWRKPMVALLHDCEARFKVRPELIRAACHLIWGRPCYPGAGALTLCESSSEEGALTLAHDGGGLEMMK